MITLKSLVLGALAVAGAWYAQAVSVEYLDPVFDDCGAVSGYVKKTAESKVLSTDGVCVLQSGWYHVVGGYAIPSTLWIMGDVHLILTDNSTLFVNSGGGNARGGLRVESGYSLTIYAQSEGGFMGQLYAYGGKYAAAIGSGLATAAKCGEITINGGHIIASGGKYGAGIGGGNDGAGQNITINGGTVTATGGEYGAGIGGGNGRSGRGIVINGGTVTAKGGDGGMHYHAGGAGIGGGDSGTGENITINGGGVTATGGKYGSGIGGGGYCVGQNITINGGSVTAIAGLAAAGIGGGGGGAGQNITINGGSVTASGGAELTRNGQLGGAGIGGGMYDDGLNYGTFSDFGHGRNITINGGEVTAYGGKAAAGIGGGNSSSGMNIIISGGVVWATGGEGGAGIGGGSRTTYYVRPFWHEPDELVVVDNGTLQHLKISGGTVFAKAPAAGFAIGSGERLDGPHSSDFVITGGSVKMLGMQGFEIQPKNASGATVYKTTVTGVEESPAWFEGIPNYGTEDLYPDDDHLLYFFLPEGSYSCHSATKYYAGSAGKVLAPTCEYYGVTVDGTEAGMNTGTDWSCANNVLTLSAARKYTLAGLSTGRLRVQVTTNATVTLDNLTMPLAADAPCIAFGSEATDAKLVLKGDSKVYARNDYPAVDVNGRAKVTLSGDGMLTGGKAAGANSRGFYNNGILVVDGGTIRNYSASSDGGAVYNNTCGGFTMNGGTISGCRSAARGGALCNDGTAKIYGGVIVDNSVVSVCQGEVHGGVFDGVPEGVVSGSEAISVAGRYVVGQEIEQSNGQLSRGTYTFNPTNDEYAAAGVKVMANCSVTERPETTPKTYIVEKPSDFYINGVKLENGSGAGWTFDDSTCLLSLTNAMDYALSGYCERSLKVDVTTNACVALTDVRITPGDLGRSVFNVTGTGVRFSLGGSSVVYTPDGHAAITVASGAKLTIDGEGTLHGGRDKSANGRCVTVAEGGTFVFAGGVITDYYTTANGGAVYNAGTFMMTGGSVLDTYASGNGTVYNVGTASVFDGLFCGNSARFGVLAGDGGILNVYGGILIGNSSKPVDRSAVYGGVYDVEPECVVSGYAAMQVGERYVVGKDVTIEDGELTGGTYYFDPSCAEYAAAGIRVASQREVQVQGTTPETYRVHVAAYFTVDGVRLEEGTGKDGWTFTQDGEKGCLTLTAARAYDLSGYADLTLLVDVLSNATVTLNGARIRAGASGREIVNVSAEDATIVLMGTNTIYATDGNAAIGVASGAKLTVTGAGELVGGRASSAYGRGFAVRGELVLDGGTVRDYCTTSDGGAVYNTGIFTMNGGMLSNNRAREGGALWNVGTARIFGGTVADNMATSCGGFCLDGKGFHTAVYGGRFRGNTTGTNRDNLFVGYGFQKSGLLYGGVFSADPTSQAESRGSLVPQDGAAVKVVGRNYIVGKDVTATDNALAGGTYCFDPTGAEYLKAGVALAEDHAVFAQATDPKTYVIDWNRTGFTVDGVDLVARSGEGWSYDFETGLLTLDTAKTNVLSGALTRRDLDLGVSVDAAAVVVLSNATIVSSVRAPIAVNAAGARVELVEENRLEVVALDGADALAAMAVADGASVTIARGGAAGERATLDAIGGSKAVAIGGEGDVTIASGVITAQGGIAGGGVRIEGGTVSATGRSGAPDIDGADVRITGGSVVARSVTDPKNADGASVWCVTVPDVASRGPLAITNQAYLVDSYGQDDLYPVSGGLSLWLPNGDYNTFYVGDDPIPYYATVDGEPTVAIRKGLNFHINDVSITNGSDVGWSYAGGVLTLDASTNYVVTGEATDGRVRVVVAGDCDVTLCGVRLGMGDTAMDANLLYIASGTVNLTIDGATAFQVTGEKAPVGVGDGATLNICGSGTVFAWKADIEGSGRITMEDPTSLTFTTKASAEAAAAVVKPVADESEFPYIDQLAYGDRFDVKAIQGESGFWTLDYQVDEATLNELQSVISSVETLTNLVAAISATNGTATVTITPIPGFYYGMAGAVEVTEMDTDAARPPAWYAGQQGKELTVRGTTFNDTDKAFYQLKASAKP